MLNFQGVVHNHWHKKNITPLVFFEIQVEQKLLRMYGLFTWGRVKELPPVMMKCR